MDFDRSKHNVIKYLPTNNDENIWGMSISGIGFQSIDPKGSYPLKGHPIGYTFNPDRGRIIDEFALVYIVKGEGTFTSINCFEKKISKGDAFFIFPGQWHSYQPIANIGWDEYYVTFQGDYFEKLLNGIIFPMEGSYTYQGHEITEKTLKDTRFAKWFHQQMGYVFQNADTQLFCGSVEEEIAFGPTQMGLSENEIRQRTEDCLKLFGIEKLRERSPYLFSVG